MQQKIADLLRCQLEVIMDKDTEAEMKRIQRSIEQVEKDFMRRELEDQSKRREIEYLVKKGRDYQIQTKRELQAIQVTRDKLYFDSDLRYFIDFEIYIIFNLCNRQRLTQRFKTRFTKLFF